MNLRGARVLPLFILLLFLPTIGAVDSLNFEISEYVILTFNSTGEAYTMGDSITWPNTVAKINGEIIVTNYANWTTMSDINFGVNRSGGINWDTTPTGASIRTIGTGIYLLHINELANQSSITFNYFINASLPAPSLNVTIEYFENATLAATPNPQTRILTNTTTDLDVRINFTNLDDTNITSLYINQTDAVEPLVTWQNTYWYNSSEKSAENETFYPHDILHWFHGGNPLGTDPGNLNNVSCVFYVRTQVNIEPTLDTPILINWQNMTIGYYKPNVSSDIEIAYVEINGVNGDIFVEKLREDYQNFSGDLAFKSNVSYGDPGIKINVTSFTIWITGNHDPNNISANPVGNASQLIKVYPINVSNLSVGRWVNSTNLTGTGTPEISTYRWKTTPWGNATQSSFPTYNRSDVPIYWGRANYTLTKAVFKNFEKNRSSQHESVNYSVYEKIYLLRGYLVRVKKTVNSMGSNLWNINITISNIGNQYTPTLFAYDLVPQNFTVDISGMKVYPAHRLNESALPPLNFSGNQSISGSMYTGWAYWWRLNPVANGANVNITYNVTGTGVYYTKDLFLIGIDPVEGFGQTSITPTIEMIQGAVSTASGEALYVVLAIFGMIGATVKRTLLSEE